jgi:hypothetical protein
VLAELLQLVPVLLSEDLAKGLAKVFRFTLGKAPASDLLVVELWWSSLCRPHHQLLA